MHPPGSRHQKSLLKKHKLWSPWGAKSNFSLFLVEVKPTLFSQFYCCVSGHSVQKWMMAALVTCKRLTASTLQCLLTEADLIELADFNQEMSHVFYWEQNQFGLKLYLYTVGWVFSHWPGTERVSPDDHQAVSNTRFDPVVYVESISGQTRFSWLPSRISKPCEGSQVSYS